MQGGIFKTERFTAADLTALPEFQPPGWPDILSHFTFYVNSTFCHPFKFMVGNKMVGTGATIMHADIAWLAHIIVHPDYRNKGIGSKITEILVESLKHSACKTIYLIATDLGAPVYTKAGFSAETNYLFFKEIVVPQQENFEHIKPLQQRFVQPLLELDYLVSGEKRNLAIQDHLQHGYIYELNNQLEGYFLPTFGEGLVVAKNPGAGIELMKMRFTKKTDACFPQENLFAKEILYQNHLKEFRAAKRMRLGQERTWHPNLIYNRIGGNMG